MKETVTLHKVLSRYLAVSVVEVSYVRLYTRLYISRVDSSHSMS